MLRRGCVPGANSLLGSSFGSRGACTSGKSCSTTRTGLPRLATRNVLGFCDSFCGGPCSSCEAPFDGDSCRARRPAAPWRRLLDGVRCIPDGGVLTTGSGWWGVGGSSGSWCSTAGNTPVLSDERCSARPMNGLSKSSSFSGAGGGRGLGCGRLGERRAGCAPRVVPPALLTGERDREASWLASASDGAP